MGYVHNKCRGMLFSALLVSDSRPDCDCRLHPLRTISSSEPSLSSKRHVEHILRMDLHVARNTNVVEQSLFLSTLF
jgi:hypothetical protein